MTTPNTPTPHLPDHRLRVSDAEREVVASRLRDAAMEGRLTMTEVDERQALAYAARTGAHLIPLTSDLPEPPPQPWRPGPLTQRARQRLGVHAALVAVVAALLVTRWATGPVPWFWPAWPLLWLAVSLLVHYRRARREPPPGDARASVSITSVLRPGRA